MNVLFDLPQISLNKKIRLITTFSGIGSQEMAMRDIGVDFDIYKAVEFDGFAMNSYNAIHGTDFKPTDICDVHAEDLNIVDTDEYDYIFVYSYPCTSLSVAGKMEGMREGSGTASSLLWEVKRIIGECHELSKEDSRYGMPKILLMENVPQVHSSVNMPEFQKWLDFLKTIGYFSHYQDLNAKDFGIPQNRERCFCVSILSDAYVDFDFPKGIPLKYVMKDFLEKDVDDKYFIKSEKADKLIKQLVEEGKLD